MSDTGSVSKFHGDQHYLKAAHEMRELFAEVPSACDNTLWIAERSNLDIAFGESELPNFPIPEPFLDDADYLRHLTFEGATRRWGDPLPDGVVDRLTYELKVIGDMGFSSYFLIVWDLIRHARLHDIRVGPGRGSAAGCAVAFTLEITDIDPIRYDLLFERFLNPSRISMPDIDMDFDSRYRDEMIRYAAQKYGRDKVAQIVTFSTIKARAAVRDAARVLGYPYIVGDKVAKAMPPLVMGRDTPLRACLELEEKFADGYKMAGDLRDMYVADPDAKKVIDVAKGLEGLRRQDGIHAAAVVITHEPLTEYLPIQRKPDPGGNPEDAPLVTQYEMHGVEELGLLKMDFLGIRNLDVITDTVKLIEETKGLTVDVDELPLDDAATYELLCRGDTIGVFQLEGSAMRDLIRRLAPNSFEDVAALVALRIPTFGPMAVNMHNDYADIKNGRKPVSYFHPDAEELLGDTYGLMIYQESVMRVAQKFAGYSLARGRQPPQGVRQEDPRADGQGAGQLRRRGDRHRVRRGARHAPVRHHRAVRRLRVQQEPQLRLRPHRLPDRLPQGEPSHRVPRLPPHERQDQPRQGRGLPGGVSGDGHRGHRARRRTAAGATSLPTRSTADVRSPSGCPRCETSVRARWSTMIVAERDANGPFVDFYDFARAGQHPGAEQAIDRIADQGRGVRLARPPPPGPAHGVRADRRRHRWPGGASYDMGVMSLFGSRRTTVRRLLRRAGR